MGCRALPAVQRAAEPQRSGEARLVKVMTLGGRVGRMPKVLPRPGSLAAGGTMTLGPDGTGKGCLLLAQRGLGGAEREGAAGSESEGGGGIRV